MARMRKIPARKHHGVRDPLKQLELKEKKLKNVTNHPPAKGNDQKMSFKFAQFKKLADDTKAGKKFKRIHRGKEEKPTAATNAAKKNKKAATTATDGNKSRPIKQFIEEADEDYLRRVNRITSESLREAQYEAKYGVSVVRDGKTGMISIRKKPKNEIDELIKHKQNEQLGGRMGRRGRKSAPPAKPLDPKVARALIKQAIKEDDEEKLQEKTVVVEEYKRDTFKFGEVVHAPPTLNTIPRKATKSETVPRPGQKGNLLLKSMLNSAAVSTTSSAPAAAAADSDDESSAPTKSKKKKKPIAKPNKSQMKGKRKQLPIATRNMLETEQSKMIELYRKLKKSKEQQATS